jgi:hypothetical protein
MLNDGARLDALCGTFEPISLYGLDVIISQAGPSKILLDILLDSPTQLYYGQAMAEVSISNLLALAHMAVFFP